MGEKVVLIGGALAGMIKPFSRIFASDFAFVNFGFGAKNCFKSLRLGEFRLNLAFGATTGLLVVDGGRLFDERSNDEAKGSAGSEGWEERRKASLRAEGGERGLS